MFRRSSKKSARTRKMTPQAMWRHMIREKKRQKEKKKKRSDNKKENKGEESERQPSPLWIDWELTHHASFQPINLIDQSS